MNIEIDQSGKVERTNQDTIVAFSNGKSSSVKITGETKRRLQGRFFSMARHTSLTMSGKDSKMQWTRKHSSSEYGFAMRKSSNFSDLRAILFFAAQCISRASEQRTYGPKGSFLVFSRYWAWRLRILLVFR